MVLNKETPQIERHRGAIELPKSPLWGYALLAIMIIFVIVGLVLMMGGSIDKLSTMDGCVALISIEGEIISSDTPESLFSTGQSGSEQIAKLIEEADERGDVKSILIQINSPGGSPLASREIYNALKETKKPTIAYLRETAASGGYYVAAGTDYIVSEPDALTGSIGVRMTIAQMGELFSRLGYNETTFKSGEFKDIGNYAREITDEEREILQSIIQQTYDEFESAVLESRKGKVNLDLFYKNVTDARILTGKQAYEIGLVDQIGSKKDAIAKASQMAGSQTPLEVCTISKKQTSLFSQMMSGMFDFSSVISSVSAQKTAIEYR